MIKKPDCYNLYNSAKDRFLKAAISQFFTREFPRLFGPVIREKLADELVVLFLSLYPQAQRLQPGQILWNALDKSTRATSPRRSYRPVVLSVITPEDVEQSITTPRRGGLMVTLKGSGLNHHNLRCSEV
jgi:hypothetical protein